MKITVFTLLGAVALSAAPGGFAATLQVPAGYATIAAAVAAASSNDTIAVRSNYAGEAAGLSFDNKNLAFISVDTDYVTPLAGAKIDQYVNIDPNFVGTGTSTVSFWGFSVSNTGSAGVQIFGNGTLSLTNCTLNSNVWNAVGVYGDGTTVNIDSTTINGNQHQGITSNYGFVNPKVINVTNGSTVDGNYTAGGGNAPSIEFASAPTILTITNSQVNNTAGAGILVGTAGSTINLNGGHANGNSVGIQANFQCAINILNGSTVSNNVWQGINRAYNGGSLSTILVDNSTVGNQVNGYGIILNNSSGPVNLTVQNNSDISTNTAGNIGTEVAGSLVISQSSVTGCTGTNTDGVLLTAGAALSLNVTSSTIAGNQRFGIFNFNCPVDPVVITGSSISGNGGNGFHNGGTLNNMSITGSTFASNADSGMFLAAAAPNGSFSNCIFSGNTNNGLVIDWNSGPFTLSVTGCAITGHTYNGLVLSNNNGQVITLPVTGCTFSGNGTDMYVAGATGSRHNVTIDRSVFRDGSANAGAVVNIQAVSNTSITNCLIDHGLVGVSINDDSGSPKVYQNTFVGSAGTALSLASAACDVKNNVFAGFPTGISGTCTSDYNLYGIGVAVPGTEGGNSVTNKNPGFVTASTGVGTGDFHLNTTSWAIDRGATGLGVTVDIEGTARALPAATVPDLGAYEETTVDHQVPVTLSGFTAD